MVVSTEVLYVPDYYYSKQLGNDGYTRSVQYSRNLDIKVK